MAFESLRKKLLNFCLLFGGDWSMIWRFVSSGISGVLALLRFAAIVGYWNFFSSMLKTLWYRPQIRFFDYKGLPIPILGTKSVDRYMELMREDLANFKTRDDDIFVVAFGKSGHHWSYDFINMLLRGNLELDNIVKEAYFIEFLLPAADGMSSYDRLPSPRMIFTHFHADALPREVFTKKRKIIRLIRNPKDVAVSAFYHRKALPKLSGTASWDDYIETMMDVIEGKKESNELFLRQKSDWFTYELDSEEKLNHLDHSIVLYYEDLKEDMVAQLKKLSAFLGKQYNEEFLEQIAEKTNLSYVKKHKDLSMHDIVVKEGSLYRKGVIGDWKNHFTAEQARRFDAIIEAKMKNCSIMANIRYEPKEAY